MSSDYHYYASSATGWVVGKTIAETLSMLQTNTTRDMVSYGNKRGKTKLGEHMDYRLIYVPLPIDAHYSIDNYVPSVEGAQMVEWIDVESKRQFSAFGPFPSISDET